MSLLLDVLYLLAFVCASPWILYRLTVTDGWALVPQRFGAGLPASEGDCLWLHGSSVGEISLLKPLVAMLERDMPELKLVISSYTRTGVAAARAAYPRHRVVVFPLDFSFVVKRFLRKLEPRAVIIVESELWPNFLAVMRRMGVPAAVVNGKMSPKSFAIHQRTKLIARALSGMQLLAVQTEEHAQRFRALGVGGDVIRVTGNMKYDLAAPQARDGVRARVRGALRYAAEEVVVIGGSLHAPEDEALLDAFAALPAGDPPRALILVPRYPADAAEAVRRVERSGFRAVRKSEVDAGAQAPGAGGVLVVDTVGELERLYAAADIAFVGGSLYYRGANKGGHNLMEPAILELPVLFGPYNFSFKETVEVLLDAEGGVLVHDAAELGAALASLVADRGKREGMGARAKRTVLAEQGATARNFALIGELLGERGARLQAPMADRTMPQAARDQRV